MHERFPDIDPDSPGARLDAATSFRPRSDAVSELRGYVDVLIKAIAEHPLPSWELDEAQWRADELAEELALDEPRPRRAKSRWMRLAPLLRTLRLDVPIATVDALINEAL